MKTRYDDVYWGILLILAGGLALAAQQGLIKQFYLNSWALAFGGLALVFFIRYLLAGLRHWGWLFPVCIFSSLAMILWLNSTGHREAWIASPLFIGLAIPFLVVLGTNFRKRWWALIPAIVMLLLGGTVAFSDRVPGEFIAAAFLFGIAISFLAVYFVDRKYWWALIPGFTLTCIGLLTLLSHFYSQWAGAFVTIAIAVPFFYIYFKQEQKWWALIPAGVMASIGINALLTMPVLGRFAQSSIPTGIMFTGWAGTFGWLWRQREKFPTAWARIPAIVCMILAIFLLVVRSLTTYGLIVALILGGALMIYFGLRPRRETPVQ